MLVLTNVAIGGFILANARIPGMLIAGLGLLMNVSVIVANGAMPVSADAADAAGLSPPTQSSAFKHEQMNSETRVRWLGDVVPLPVLGEVWSAGDFVLAAGIARLIYARMLTRKRRSSDEAVG